MRQALVSFVLVLLFVGLGAFIAARHGWLPTGSTPASLAPADADVLDAGPLDAGPLDAGPLDDAGSPIDAPAAPNDADDADVTDAFVAPADAFVEPADAFVEPAEAPASPRLLDRRVRLVALQWDFATPALLAAGGLTSTEDSLLEHAHVQQSMRVVSRPEDVTRALALGGDDDEGADLAILPLSTWIAAAESLAALELEAFVIAGFSRGADALYRTAALDVAQPIARTRPLVVDADVGAPAGLALWTVLAEMDLPASALRPAGEATGAEGSDGGVMVWARTRELRSDGSYADAPAGQQLWLTSVDGARLVPWVVVAPHAFVRDHHELLVAWTSAWLVGVDRLARDVPAAARLVATQAGAPSLVELLARLGRVDHVPLATQLELTGLAGDASLTLEALYVRGWARARERGRLVGPAPSHAPLATGALAELARRDPPAAVSRTSATCAASTRTLAAFPLPMPRSPRDTATATRAATRIGFLAGAFPGACVALRVPRERLAATRSWLPEALPSLAASRVEITAARDARLELRVP